MKKDSNYVLALGSLYHLKNKLQNEKKGAPGEVDVAIKAIITDMFHSIK